MNLQGCSKVVYFSDYREYSYPLFLVGFEFIPLNFQIVLENALVHTGT